VYSVRRAHRPLALGSETIPELNAVSFAGALQGLTFTSAVPGEVKDFTERRKNFVRMKRYGAAVTTSVLFVLLVLLFNFFLFTHFRQLKSDLEADPRIHSESLQRFNALSEQVEASREFFEASGWSGTTSYAWIADQLAAQLPTDVMLTRMNVAPAQNFNREDTLAFDPNRILINGTCRESASLNNWLKILQHSGWVSGASVTSYTDAGGLGKFELQVEFR
jgi:Tfp pilus assembly protein PilN